MRVARGPDEDEPEPPVPPGLGTLSGALASFREFLRIDPDLVQAAAERSQPLAAEPPPDEVRAWTDEQIVADCRRVRAEAAAREKERRQREAAAAREKHLDRLAPREAETWGEVDALIATKQPKSYDQAVSLLQDLHDLAARDGRSPAFDAHHRELRETHARKPSFLDRLRKGFR